MTDFVWPADLVPYQQEFWLQPHTGGTESPFSRQTKVYGLSAPRWICSMSFRVADSRRRWGDGPFVTGPLMDGFLAKLEGRLNRVALHDFRRPLPSSESWPSTASNLAAALGDTSMTVTGLYPGTPVFAGDYIGGDGRPHIITDTVYANSSGNAVVSFRPPLRAAVGAGAATFSQVTGLFRLASDDAGQNGSAVGELATYTLNFIEDL